MAIEYIVTLATMHRAMPIKTLPKPQGNYIKYTGYCTGGSSFDLHHRWDTCLHGKQMKTVRERN